MVHGIFDEKIREAKSIKNISERNKAIADIMDWKNTYDVAVDFGYYDALDKIKNARNAIHANNILISEHKRKFA